MTGCSKDGFCQLAASPQIKLCVEPLKEDPGPEEMRFFIYLLEQYAAGKNTGADKVLKDWDRLHITDIILGRCRDYRAGTLEDAFSDIDSLR